VEQSVAMNDSNNTAAGLNQADEDIITYTVSDEALEAAAGTERGPAYFTAPPVCFYTQQTTATACCE
jgi:hypothetical protein